MAVLQKPDFKPLTEKDAVLKNSDYIKQLAAGKDAVFNPEKVAAEATGFAKTSASKFEFSLDGKLTYGTIKEFDHVIIKGGEIPLYKLGAAGVGAAYCGATECYKAAGRAVIQEAIKLKEVKEMLESIEKAKKPEVVAD